MLATNIFQLFLKILDTFQPFYQYFILFNGLIWNRIKNVFIKTYWINKRCLRKFEKSKFVYVEAGQDILSNNLQQYNM